MFLSLKSTPQQQLRSYVTAVDRVFTRVSPYLFTMLVVIAVGWSIENAPRTQISLNRDYKSAPGAVLDLNLPVSIAQDRAKSAVYEMYLVDARGDVAFEFPEERMINVNQVGPQSFKLNVPSRLSPGTYSVYVKIIYQFNPLKNGRVDVSVGTLHLSPI